MKVSDEVKLIEYSPAVDRWNCVTHAAGSVIGLVCAAALIVKAAGTDGMKEIISSVIYSLAFLTVYTSSAVYHGLPPGEAKRKARLFDHMAIPLLLAATTTPCALISLGRVSPVHGVIVFAAAWFCALFGIISKLFFFEKTRAAVMAVYFGGGAAMLLSAVPYLQAFDKTAFALLCAGSVVYIIAGLICKAGIKRPALHPVFHVVVLAGSMTHFAVIYFFII